MGLRYAAEQIGIGAEAATAGITGLATAIRTNPGLGLFYKSLGLKQTGDNTKDFIQLITKLKGMSDQGPFGHAIATQIASQFGIDEQTLFMYEKHLPELIKAQQQFQRLGLMGGIDVEKQSEAFHDFMNDVRQLLATAEFLAIAFGGELLPYAKAFVHYLQIGLEFMLKMHQATHGLSTMFAGLSTVLGSIWGGTKILSAIGGLSAAAGQRRRLRGGCCGGRSGWRRYLGSGRGNRWNFGDCGCSRRHCGWLAGLPLSR